MSNLIKYISQPSVQSAVASVTEGTTVVEVLEQAAQEEKEESIPQINLDAFYVQSCVSPFEQTNNITGNKVHLVNKGAYLPENYKNFYKDIDFKKPFSYNDEIEDNLRFASQKYWFNKENKTVEFARLNDLVSTNEIPFEMRISPATYTGNLIEQIVHLIPREAAFARGESNTYDSSTWYTYLNGGKINYDIFEPLVDLGRPYNDLNFSYRIPIDEDISVLAKKADIKVNYNFHIKEFERIASLRELPETIMPNVYAMVAHLENLAGNPDVESLNKLDDLLTDILIPQRNGDSLTFRDNAQYFNEWARNALQTSIPWRDKMSRKFGDIIFSADELEMGLLDTVQDRENIYPFSFQIDFTTDSTTEFTQILKDSLLDKNFNATLVRELIAEKEGFINTIEKQDFAVAKYFDNLPLTDNKTIRTWDISQWLIKLQNPTTTLPIASPISNPTQNIEFDPSFGALDAVTKLETNIINLVNENTAFDPAVLNPLNAGDYATFIDAIKDAASQEEYNGFYQQILRLIFTGKMKKFVDKHARTYCDIISGRPAYSEPVLYRISKHAVLPSGVVLQEPIQNFYFPNSNEIDVISFVDTQVKYNKSYVYKIWSYNVVVGNQYIYEPLVPKSKKNPPDFIQLGNNDIASFKVRNLPILYIAEVEEQIFDPIRLMDNPPLPPTIEFIPYMGEDKKIAISMCNSGGDLLTEPIAIEPEDSFINKQLLLKQKSKDRRVQYEGDDSINKFEIYRILDHPSSYREFQGAKLAEVLTEMPSNSLQRSDEVTYIDQIRPNTKYYYIFRAIDAHGHKSNPTPVFEIELVNNSGAVYPLIRTVEFLNTKKVYPTKDFRKYLRINAAEQQKTINLDKSKLVGITVPIMKAPDNVVLGTAEKSIWGKKFKLRLTSKSSGKKIDINFQLNTKTKEFKATNIMLDDIIVDDPNSIADILNSLTSNK